MVKIIILISVLLSDNHANMCREIVNQKLAINTFKLQAQAKAHAEVQLVLETEFAESGIIYVRLKPNFNNLNRKQLGIIEDYLREFTGHEFHLITDKEFKRLYQ